MNLLFDIEPLKKYIILSASRMTDMPKFYPNEIIEQVNLKIEKGMHVHTLVLWTKHPDSLLKNPLCDFLLELKKKDIQLYLQLTITGLGGVETGKLIDNTPFLLEPCVPKYEDSMAKLPDLVFLTEKPERIRLRIDPIIRIQDATGQKISNIGLMPKIIEKASKLGINTFSFSFLENDTHKKVDKRFKELGIKIIPPNEEERKNTVEWLKKIEQKYNVKIYSCSVPGLEISKCIDGDLLEKLHDKNFPTNLKQPFKRKLCGCTDSIDIGGWPPKKCYSGCLYCYSNPISPDLF